ncbi:type II secretion system F family protein [Shewanella surugensis]|uniref:Type II secretion system F family protein n=1 Tax=Shewanella surugensis TaxID=212020 RepID=A0ABT0LIM0_9GAMM|nr:type II secretion system F family protein [Shewanella surugensis]MCL1127305.1 type II secretion system F family protein [Shewanella surugensis]
MDYLIGLLGTIFNDPEYVKWAIYAIAAIAGITLAISIYFLTSGIYSPLKTQLKRIYQADKEHPMTQTDVNATIESSMGRMARKTPFNLSNNQTRRLLIHAGFHSENELAVFSSVRLILLLISAGLSALILSIFPNISGMMSVYVVACLLGSAYLLPSIVLQNLGARRMKNLRASFPDALDLLVVCCEAGLGLLAALQRVANELAISHASLASELDLICSKVRMGLTIKMALQEFTERTGLEDIKGLNSAISQSIRLGTGIADTLRVFSDEYRDKRLQEAEERAAKLAVKMIFPMMLCIWPSFFIVAVGPAVLKVMKVWGQAF